MIESKKPIDRLEEEIKRWWGEEYMKNTVGLPILPIVQGIARHFAEWGYLRAAEKYNEMEYNRQRAEESVPNDLEEAANRFAVFYDQGTCDGIAQDCFIAGAKWNREQMMKEALEGWVAVDSDTEGKRRVTFFPKKPVRDVLTQYKYWAATRPSYESIKLDSNAFPNLKWEDEPKKVHIIIVNEEENGKSD